MSFIEVSDAMFRGELRGANGVAKFKLTAEAIDAVDTINVAGGQVTFSYYFSYGSKSVTSGGESLVATIDVPDSSAFIEIISYGHGASSVRVNGVDRLNRNLRSPSFECLPFVEVVELPKGIHTISLISGFTGTSSFGYILCRYIRRTGLDNT